MQLKILSWNIWCDGDFSEISKFLQSSNSDIISLQEVMLDDPTRDIIGFLVALGYEHVFAPFLTLEKDGRTMSNAIFSKYPIVGKNTHMLSETDSRIALQADIKVGESMLHIVNTHLLHTHQRPSEIQNLQADNLTKILPSKHTVAMGDFNATPDSVVINKMRAIMSDTDPASAPTLDASLFHCSGEDPQTIASTRLDYIFTSKDIKTSSFAVHHAKGSDHFPISVDIEI